MANSIDFRADQVQTSKIIVTGSAPEKTLLIYSIDADGTPPNQGNIDPTVFNTSSIGSDVFFFVSGAVGGRGGTDPVIAVIGGDLHVSGNLTVDGTYPAGGGGTNYFTEIALNSIKTTGSVAMTFLSASTGAEVTGSLKVLGGITGSLSGTVAGNPFIVAGSNITANYNSLGQWEITSSGGGGGGINYFTEVALNSIATTGSVAMTLLSASTGARITGSITQGAGNTASGTDSFARGNTTVASGQYAFSEGYGGCLASGDYSHAQGYSTVASGQASHSEGIGGTASGLYSHNEGGYSQAQQAGSHSEGYYTNANAVYSHTEGANTVTTGPYSHAEGGYSTASGTAAHAEGNGTVASGNYSHSEGRSTTASGQYAHSEGDTTQANGLGSHAEGYLSVANGIVSHAEGVNTNAFGTGSLAAGLGTIASGAIDGVSPQTTVQAAFGKYNLGNNVESLFVIGDGLDGSNRHDVLRVNSGSVQVTGSLEVLGAITGSISGTVASNPFIVGGANITTNYNSLGQWEVTGSGGGFTAADLVALTQATNPELNDDSLAYVVIDPSGTPASRKTTLARMGALPDSYLDMVTLHQTIGIPSSGDYTIGVRFYPARASQKCTGIRVYWRGTSSVTLKLGLYEVGVGGILASGNVTTTTTPGIYTVTFGGAVALDPKKQYIASCYETSGSVFLSYAGNLTILAPPLRFRDYHITDSYYYDTGDINPTLPYVGYVVELEPLISG